MLCSKCGKENNGLARFCEACGSNLYPTITESNIQQSAVSSGVVEYAGFWIRFGAFFIDTIFVVGFLVLARIPFLLLEEYGGTESTNPLFVFTWVLICIVIPWLYWAGMESSTKQATFGKRALRIIVSDLEKNRISFGRATGRYFGKAISSLILFIGFIIAGFTKKKQALHDIMAGTVVLVKK
jgi:uncharacterized RDD family membrane protein YckC